jgi:hypothetical protein
MTELIPHLLAALALLAVHGLIRARLAVAERQRRELEAFKAELGIPADRFRIEHLGLWESLAAALPWRRLPRFAEVHRVHPSGERRKAVVGDGVA